MERGEEQIDYPEPVIDSPQHFHFQTQPDKIWHGYSFVGDAEAQIAKIALVGTYVDPKGRIVEFGADGILRGMGKNARFSLDNDHVGGNPFDFFYLGDNQSKAIGFEHRGASLILYPILPISPDSDDPSVGRPEFKHPLLVLKQQDYK